MTDRIEGASLDLRHQSCARSVAQPAAVPAASTSSLQAYINHGSVFAGLISQWTSLICKGVLYAYERILDKSFHRQEAACSPPLQARLQRSCGRYRRSCLRWRSLLQSGASFKPAARRIKGFVPVRVRGLSGFTIKHK